MIRRLDVTHFKGFERFTATFEMKTVLIGPNNAGKSTLINALRSCAHMFRYAQRRKPELREDATTGVSRLVYPFEGDPFAIGFVNLQHDFRPGSSTIELLIEDPDLVLRAEFPENREHWFSISDPNSGWQPTAPKELRPLGSLIGAMPPLTPVEEVESLLDEKYVARNIDGRLSSRHFRNQLRLLRRGRSDLFDGDYESYMELCALWAPDIALEPPEIRQAEEGLELDVFYNEGRGPRELVWAGDGFQVWLQLLLHLMRLQGQRTIILDEPEVFLHPDLQRRLVHFLEGLSAQSVMATHSPEIAAEFDDEAVALVDRDRRGTYRPSGDDPSQQDLGLGTRFNFALAKSLRAKLSLFVEGKDLSILRRLAAICGAERLARESGIAVVKLDGIDNRWRLQGFGWLAEKVLGGSLHGEVLLDRDYRTTALCDDMTAELRSAGLGVHVWSRKELESYFLEPSALSRLSEAPKEQIEGWMDQIAQELKPYVTAQYVTVQQQNRDKRQAPAVAAQEAIEYLEAAWTAVEHPILLCPARNAIKSLNMELKAGGFHRTPLSRLSREFLEEEVPTEMFEVISRIEEQLA